MSREDEGGCKLTSVYKHKERKPKKPHYIPRPWGKPYNYKCFQCPFTCMEKSHLYNHMKYSLCKNSLSLLIESDWPYKKGNLLHPELHLLHATEALRHRSHQPDDGNSQARPAKPAPKGSLRDAGKVEAAMTTDASEDDLHPFQEDDEEEEEEEEEEGDAAMAKEMDQRQKKEEEQGQKRQGASVESDTGGTLLGLKNKRAKSYKDAEPDFIITDVYSLKNQVTKGKESTAVEAEIKARQCKSPTSYHGSKEALLEQWKQPSKEPRRVPQEVPPQSNRANGMPCYPPPPYSDYHEPQGLNLSLLGINYPVSPNLFSYLAPTLANSMTSHPHLTQLPFLASTAQLMHPHSAHFPPLQSQERSPFLPRFYYPLLFEHSFGGSEVKMATAKTEPQQPSSLSSGAPAHTKPPGEERKDDLHKIPTVTNCRFPWSAGLKEKPLPPDLKRKLSVEQEEDDKWSCDGSNANKASNSLHQRPPPVAYRNTVLGHKDGSSLSSRLQKSEITMAACVQRAGALEGSLKTKSLCRSGRDLPDDLTTTENPGNDQFNYQSSLQAATQPPTSKDHSWLAQHNPPQAKMASSEALASRIISAGQHECRRKPLQESSSNSGEVEAATLLIEDLSKTLEEYQAVEKTLSDLAKKDNPGQKELREQLVKIRRELRHIHQALEKASKPHEGPLDLSVKRSLNGQEKSQNSRKEACREHVPHHRPASPVEDCDDEDATFYSHDEDNQAIQMMIRMSRSESLRPSCDTPLGPAAKAETLPPDLRHVMEPYYSRTTKCEADSSVLLSTDGRSVQTVQCAQQHTAPEEGPLGARTSQREQSCGGSSVETEILCLHNPLNRD
ncbi:proline-rich protein 35 [Ambystoma mexicanum]|uniref:proline-rich protein 35 n=1 Tax=Ambystoma mexicanum TaxID=8296 RepID=UPI0037E81B37